MNIAIIGTGIAGLSAAWYLGKQHQVTLYERNPQLGMAAFGVDIGGARIDMPLRVIYQRYYPTLSQLYADAGIATQGVSYSGSFSQPGQPSYFRYRNVQALNRSLPLPAAGTQTFRRSSRRIIADIVRFYANAKNQPADPQTTLPDWVKRYGYSKEFHQEFLRPTFAGIATCSYEQVDNFPAQIIVDYLIGGVIKDGVRRTTLGADNVVTQLSKRASQHRLSCAIATIESTDAGIDIVDSNGHRASHDHVIVATQANQAAELLQQIEPEVSDLLGRFQYQHSEVVVHRDKQLAPKYLRDWSPVNFIVDPAEPMPMATIWLNNVLAIDKREANVFQTWNPHQQPQENKVLCRAQFERPLLDSNTGERLKLIRQLHQQPNRRIWLCGSYASNGVPLLESAAASSKAVAQHISQRTGRLAS